MLNMNESELVGLSVLDIGRPISKFVIELCKSI